MARGTYTVERQRHIGAPPGAVRERIVDFRRWRAWSPWEEVDPDLQREYTGAAAGVGAVYAWRGNRRAGEGRMEITGVDEERVDIDLRFVKPFKSRNAIAFMLEPNPDGTLVTWRMTGPHSLLSKAMGIFTSMDKMIGPDFDKGLDRLKVDVERG